MSTAKSAAKSGTGEIQSRTLKWLAWSLVGVYIILAAVGLTLQVLTH